jgi:hypothetical protein
LTQSKFAEGASKTYRLKGVIDNNSAVYVIITITEAPCELQSITANDKDLVSSIEATAGKD